jgi:DNA-binding FadR family transcriptional regulator
LPGDLVYSAHQDALDVVPVLRVGKTPVFDHEVVRVVTENGTVLEISARHPTADGRTFADLQVGSVLEGLAARLAAESGECRALTALRGAYQAHVMAVDAGSDHLRERDLEFHHSLAQASGNRMLTAMLCRDFYSFFAICRRQFARVPGRDQRAVVEHRRVVEAIEDGDGELAELQMRRHVLNARRNFEVALAARSTPAAALSDPAPETT